MTTIANSALLLSLVLTMVWLVLCQRLFSLLEKGHPDAFAAIGSPHLFLNNTPRHSLLVLGFIFGGAGRAIRDVVVQRALRILRILFATVVLLHATFVWLMFLS